MKKKIELFITWSKVSKCAGNGSTPIRRALHHKLGGSEIRNMGLVIRIQQYIFAGYVPVNDRWRHVGMHVRQGMSDALDDVHSLVPTQFLGLLFVAQNCRQASSFGVLGDQKGVPGVTTEAIKPRYVPVAYHG